VTHKIVGLDLAYRSSGVALGSFYSGRLSIKTFKFTTKGSDREVMGSFFRLFESILVGSDLVVYEDVIVVAQRAKASCQISKVHGVLKTVLWRKSLKSMAVHPSQLKSFMGTGREKPQSQILKDSDELDATCLLLMGAVKLGEISLEEVQRRLVGRITLEE